MATKKGKAKRRQIQINKLSPDQGVIQDLTQSEAKQVVGGECPGGHGGDDPPPVRAIVPPPQRYIPSDQPERFIVPLK